MTDRLGDPLPPGAVARFGTTRLRHWSVVTFVAFLPDNKTLISAGEGTAIRTWDVTTGLELAPFNGQCFGYGAYALLPDGKTLVSSSSNMERGSTEKGFRRWDVATRKPLGNLVENGFTMTFASAAATPDGTLLATGLFDKPGKVFLWDAATLRLVRELDGLGSQCQGLSISPDGKTLVACGGGTFPGTDSSVVMWEVATGRQLWKAQRNLVLSVVFLSDGKTVAAGGDTKGSTTLYDAATGEEKGVLRSSGRRLAASPDGKMLAIACEPTAKEWPGAYGGSCAVCLWDLAANKAVRTLVGNQYEIYAMAFSPDSKTLAAGCGQGAMALWDVASGRRLHDSPGHAFPIHGLAVAPDGKTVASRGNDHKLNLWDPKTGKKRETFELTGSERVRAGERWDLFQTSTLAYSHNGKWLAASCGQGELVRVWDTRTGRTQVDLPSPGDSISCLAFAPDDKTLVCGDQEGVLHVFDLKTGKAIQHLTFQRDPRRNPPFTFPLAFSPDSKALAALYYNKEIRSWDLTTGALLPNKFPSFAFGFPFWDDGRILIVGDAHRDNGPVISLLDLKTGTPLRTLRGHEEVNPSGGEECLELAVSPDGQLLASGSIDRTVRVWELATGEEVLCLKGHERPVLTVAFSPDGKYVVSGSRDTTALVWDLYPSRIPGVAGPVAPLTAEQSKDLWADLAAKDARRAFHASVVLTRHPAEALALLEKQLRPAVPVNLDKALKDLDADDFTVRQAASVALRDVGRPARSALERALAAGPSAEMRRRLEAILEQIGPLALDGERLRQKRAFRILEVIGSEPARRLLEALSKGEELAEQTLDVRAALERIKKRSAGR